MDPRVELVFNMEHLLEKIIDNLIFTSETRLSAPNFGNARLVCRQWLAAVKSCIHLKNRRSLKILDSNISPVVPIYRTVVWLSPILVELMKPDFNPELVTLFNFTSGSLATCLRIGIFTCPQMTLLNTCAYGLAELNLQLSHFVHHLPNQFIRGQLTIPNLRYLRKMTIVHDQKCSKKGDKRKVLNFLDTIFTAAMAPLSVEFVIKARDPFEWRAIRRAQCITFLKLTGDLSKLEPLLADPHQGPMPVLGLHLAPEEYKFTCEIFNTFIAPFAYALRTLELEPLRDVSIIRDATNFHRIEFLKKMDNLRSLTVGAGWITDCAAGRKAPSSFSLLEELNLSCYSLNHMLAWVTQYPVKWLRSFKVGKFLRWNGTDNLTDNLGRAELQIINRAYPNITMLNLFLGGKDNNPERIRYIFDKMRWLKTLIFVMDDLCRLNWDAILVGAAPEDIAEHRRLFHRNESDYNAVMEYEDFPSIRNLTELETLELRGRRVPVTTILYADHHVSLISFEWSFFKMSKLRWLAVHREFLAVSENTLQKWEKVKGTKLIKYDFCDLL